MVDRGALEARLLDHMKEHRLKQTRQRQVLFDVLLLAEGHLSVEDVVTRAQAELPGLGHATVYRTLKLFVEAGVAHERRFQDGQTRYEPVEAGGHHDHLICKTCGHIFEFEDDEIERRQARVAKAHGLRVVSHRHDIYGECLAPDSCAWKKQANA